MPPARPSGPGRGGRPRRRLDPFLSDLASIIPRPASKLFLGYDRPWWKDLGLRAGRSVTDLPLRQVHYWGVEGEQAGADPSHSNGLLLASYNDIRGRSANRAAPWTVQQRVRLKVRCARTMVVAPDEREERPWTTLTLGNCGKVHRPAQAVLAPPPRQGSSAWGSPP